MLSPSQADISTTTSLMSSLVCSCFVFIFVLLVFFWELFYAHVHYLDCCTWVLCHQNWCEPTAARMVHAQRCVDAAAVVPLRTHGGDVSMLAGRCWSASCLIPPFWPLALVEPAEIHRTAPVVLSSKTALLWLFFIFIFFLSTLKCPTVVHLQWSRTSCTMWNDSMQSKKGHKGPVSAVELTLLTWRAALLQIPSYATPPGSAVNVAPAGFAFADGQRWTLWTSVGSSHRQLEIASGPRARWCF